MSELLYSGKSLQEIAGYDAYVLFAVGKKRDKWGKLLRAGEEELEDDGMRKVENPISFVEMFLEVQLNRGKTLEEAKQILEAWKQDNPRFGRSG